MDHMYSAGHGKKKKEKKKKKRSVPRHAAGEVFPTCGALINSRKVTTFLKTFVSYLHATDPTLALLPLALEALNRAVILQWDGI